jgi:bifunctional non-homologous end joining protein LigD
VVFKRLDAPYTPGRPSRGGSQLKYKFYATASLIVAHHNDQRSVELRLADQAGSTGNVTIPPDHPVPPVGAVVEVRYLYAFRQSGCLYQPVYLGVRDDTDPAECTADQLKYQSPDEQEAA